ncbi:hypothetical protein BN2476_110143 [Paraburkholderia piptadeniae]|uniref:Uncharacterized protein n=1 Tax=Paraburkholderia piptadeniae TaxID=1701573 RepID=A0A1N7RQ53_9BURK|nr:hypothetical protein BN2476_110143 [Paraburkholderia piptadeniae]
MEHSGERQLTADWSSVARERVTGKHLLASDCWQQDRRGKLAAHGIGTTEPMAMNMATFAGNSVSLRSIAFCRKAMKRDLQSPRR